MEQLRCVFGERFSLGVKNLSLQKTMVKWGRGTEKHLTKKRYLMATQNKKAETFKFNPKTNTFEKSFNVRGGNNSTWADIEVPFNLIVDMSNCPQEKLVELASRSLIISFQNRLRTQTLEYVQNLAKQPYKTTYEQLTATAEPLTPFQQAQKAAMKMSAEEKAELLKLLQAN